MRLFAFLLTLTACTPTSYAPATDIRAHAALVSTALGPVCSSVVLGPSTALTAAHCVRPGLQVDGREVDHVTYPWVGHDIALVFVRGTLRPAPAALGLGHPQHMRVVGYGCSGMVSLDVRPLRAWPELDPTYAHGLVCPGDSGSGVFDAAGDLVAIATAYFLQGNEHGSVVQWLD